MHSLEERSLDCRWSDMRSWRARDGKGEQQLRQQLLGAGGGSLVALLGRRGNCNPSLDFHYTSSDSSPSEISALTLSSRLPRSFATGSAID